MRQSGASAAKISRTPRVVWGLRRAVMQGLVLREPPRANQRTRKGKVLLGASPIAPCRIGHGRKPRCEIGLAVLVRRRPTHDNKLVTLLPALATLRRAPQGFCARPFSLLDSGLHRAYACCSNYLHFPGAYGNDGPIPYHSSSSPHTAVIIASRPTAGQCTDAMSDAVIFFSLIIP